MKIPISNFAFGELVDVKVVEAGYPPTFRAKICGIAIDSSRGLNYTVIESNGERTDGYSEDWLTAVNPKELKIEKLEAQNAELLAALKGLLASDEIIQFTDDEVLIEAAENAFAPEIRIQAQSVLDARKAIQKAEGGE